MAFDAIVFDLDGTLLDSLPDLTSSTNAALRFFGLPEHTPQEMLSFIGKGMRYQIETASGLSGTDLDHCIDLYQKHYARHCAEGTVAYAGLPELLTRLHGSGIKIAVVTNKPEAIARDVVEHYFPNCMDVIVGGDTPGVALKPDPSGIQLALRQMGAKKAVHVGDGVTDIRAAKAAGLPVIGVTWGYNARDKLTEADALIDSPAEFEDALRRLSGPDRPRGKAGKRVIAFAVLALLILGAYFGFFRSNLPMAADGGMAVTRIAQYDYPETLCTVDGIKRSVKSSGCGATCVAMASQYYNGENEAFSPPELFTWAYKTGLYVGSGMDKNGMQALAEHCGLKSEWTDSTQEVLNAFRKKRLVIGYMGKGEFTKGGHFILLRGVNKDGLVLVNDPNSEERSATPYALEFLYDQLKYHPGFMILYK